MQIHFASDASNRTLSLHSTNLNHNRKKRIYTLCQSQLLKILELYKNPALATRLIRNEEGTKECVARRSVTSLFTYAYILTRCILHALLRSYHIYQTITPTPRFPHREKCLVFQGKLLTYVLVSLKKRI